MKTWKSVHSRPTGTKNRPPNGTTSKYKLRNYPFKIFYSELESKTKICVLEVVLSFCGISNCPPTFILPSCTVKPYCSVYAVDNKPCRPCSIQCQGVVGLIPTLQCRVCLCLFHNECVGLAPHTVVQGYVCKVSATFFYNFNRK